ncbi:MAG: DUF1003 domain-containing protein [Planctomycetaceae bacterium]|nr:DUF1003 domain-containing protein [Planctomycetaceae bacterium]
MFVRRPVFELIAKDHPNWNERSQICATDLNRYRSEYIEDTLEQERGELSELERRVVESLREHELLSANVNQEFDQQITLGERVADHVASFGGSWTFILLFTAVLTIWVAINSVAVMFRPFDPYPYILLNLVLSCLAAIQAPVIMMSQNRQEAKDRLRSEHDYRVNLKAELEIRHLHSKLDLLLTHQWQRLLEIQQLQTDLLGEIANRESN